VLDLRPGLGFGSAVQLEERMLKRQATLRLDAEADNEGASVWHSIPSSDQQRIVALLSRLIGRTARQPLGVGERERQRR
jgi:hypothetical protein